jgi:hypothetical protein
MKPYLITICFFSVIYSFYAQSITGSVFDGTTKEPLAGVNVYFEGSTLGAVTDVNGYFKIKIPGKLSKPLVISFIGYGKLIIEQPFKENLSQLLLIPEATVLQEVVVKDDPFSRRQKLRAFKREFLGKTRAGRSCIIENPDVIQLRFDSTTNTLKASANEPLVIKNNYLGYKVTFEIINFEILFSRKSLSPTATLETRFSGFTFYRDLYKGIELFKFRRKEVYEGSCLHFMRTTANQSWELENFQLYDLDFENKRIPVLEPSEYISVIKEGSYSKVKIKGELFFSFKNKKRSSIKTKTPFFKIDPYGNHSPAEDVKFQGWIAGQRAGDLLPNDYGIWSF